MRRTSEIDVSYVLSYSYSRSDAYREEIVGHMTNQAEGLVSQLDDIVTSCRSAEQNVFSPQEVMRFYHALPEERKVSKFKRSKYRKYSLTTEMENFKRSRDTSSMY
eukprot:TRINITY_DN3789_c0_g1_i2.p1 TRINITY_DN3789_c0_g1~~TRINITY_DN3789_c0_g1_i2.p1  ORF type:complete len:106 (-),score=14.47 TRINITY_DN3789_c0_g1_i2:98-415(-)